MKFSIDTDSNHGVLKLANTYTFEIIGRGTVQFTTKVHGESNSVSIENTSHAPDLSINLLSV